MTAGREPIAVVGVAGRFPGVAGLDELWDALVEGRELLTRFTPEQLAAAGVTERERDDVDYVPVRGTLDGIEDFDAAFFGLSPREAMITDPQHRLLLECAWEALEYAGHPPSREPGRIGVFVGTGVNTYLANHLLGRPDLLAELGPLPILIGNEKDHAATRIAYRLGLRGAAIGVQTACSTSLVAVHLACESLHSGDTDIALAGGATVSTPQQRGYRHEPNGIGAPDGHCRAFAADAAGTVAGNGAGIVVLRRLCDAVADGDPVLGLVLGSAVNNDGAAKVGYTAPGVAGQAEVIGMAWARAGVDPASVDVVEAHGTGTEVGDAIEVAGLGEALGRGGPAGVRLLGSVKPNLGHLDAAAGITGMIKMLLALRHGIVPPTVNHDRPHPGIPFAEAGLRVNTTAEPWPARGGPRRGCVSSFGIGGTNAHVVLQEAPPTPATPRAADADLVVLSGRTPQAVRAAARRLADHLANTPRWELADVAHTSRAGRTAWPVRRAIVATDRADLLRQLGTEAEPVAVPRRATLAFAFPGQGSQFPGMAAGLHARLPGVRERIDAGLDALPAGSADPVRAVLLDPSAAAQAARPSIAQPALFLLEYALGGQLLDWGLRPQRLIGHSVGEYAAFCLAGGLRPADALALLTERGRLVERTPPGRMAAVLADRDRVAALLPPGVQVAADNAPGVTVVSGPPAGVRELSDRCATAGIRMRPVPAAHGFHSSLLDSIRDDFRTAVTSVPHHPVTTTVLCGLTGQPVVEGTTRPAEHWVRQMCEPVRFREAAAELLTVRHPVVLEVGPGRALTALVRAAGGGRVPVAPTMPAAAGPDALPVLLRAVATAWSAGVEPDWAAFRLDPAARRVPLPAYPFERARHWVDLTPPGAAAEEEAKAEEAKAEVPAEPAEPETPAAALEREIIAAWRDLLGATDVVPESDFFALGGESLVAVRMLSRLRQRCGVRVPLRILAQDPTVRGLTRAALDRLPAPVN
ncbi:beta-ketoacyl synthase N-terminal-like domain-containing protein [Micromonospora sp. WMMD998]|uniref:type I polyketide synthase n=1 Tax=Micromonospora sp. WMMD998 TaxID=3016092 RepID=UPI00249B6222|nr:beta-ketoacyl synthase N-terminal-like domain-containing protein [Micromonospora sp. WMMD998]WFE41072.1 beta-ketoacyl synthase N-terminal-like domain-containing protein [Micromonospora sp. WMMD998]